MNKKELSHIVNEIAKKDDKDAFNRLFKYYFPQLISYVTAIVKQPTLAEEVVGDVFVGLWKNRQMIHTIKSLPYYLYAASKNTAINYLTRNKPNEYIDIESIDFNANVSTSTPESKLIEKEEMERVLKAVNTLPHRCRMIFRLVKEEKLSHKEVAQLMDISTKTVEKQITIALHKIFDALQEGARRHYPLSKNFKK